MIKFLLTSIFNKIYEIHQIPNLTSKGQIGKRHKEKISKITKGINHDDFLSILSKFNI